VGDQGQPFRVPVQFAPAADIPLRGHEEINGPLKFMGPVFPDEIARFSYRSDDGARRDHGIQGQIKSADDSPPIWRAGLSILCREQRGLTGGLNRKWWEKRRCLGLLWAFG